MEHHASFDIFDIEKTLTGAKTKRVSNGTHRSLHENAEGTPSAIFKKTPKQRENQSQRPPRQING